MIQCCPICLENVNDDGYITYCNHVFHRTCIQTHFLRDIRCPCCRRYVDGVKTRKIYLKQHMDLSGTKKTIIINSDGIILSCIPLWLH